jgi:hypothetical protein
MGYSCSSSNINTPYSTVCFFVLKVIGSNWFYSSLFKETHSPKLRPPSFFSPYWDILSKRWQGYSCFFTVPIYKLENFLLTSYSIGKEKYLNLLTMHTNASFLKKIISGIRKRYRMTGSATSNFSTATHCVIIESSIFVVAFNWKILFTCYLHWNFN